MAKKTRKGGRKGGKKKKKKKKSAAEAARARQADRSLVSARQQHEVYYLARKHGVSAGAVRDAIRRVGSSRTRVEAELAA